MPAIIAKRLASALRRSKKSVHELIFLPHRSYDAKYGPPKELGDGMPAVNFATGQMWLGVLGAVVEVRDLQHLITLWEIAVKKHAG